MKIVKGAKGGVFSRQEWNSNSDSTSTPEVENCRSTTKEEVVEVEEVEVGMEAKTKKEKQEDAVSDPDCMT